MLTVFRSCSLQWFNTGRYSVFNVKLSSLFWICYHGTPRAYASPGLKKKKVFLWKLLTCLGKWRCFNKWFFKIIIAHKFYFHGLVSHTTPSCDFSLCQLVQWGKSLSRVWLFATPWIAGHHQLLEFTQTHVHRVSDAIQPSHPLSSPSSPAPNPSQHLGLFQYVNSSHEVAKVSEFQL